MKKFTGMTCLLVFIAVALVVSGCASKPAAPVMAEKTVPLYDIIDHGTMAYGGNVPEWVMQFAVISRSDFAEKYFPGKAVFIVSEAGNNLNSLKTWANRFSVNTEIARVISSSVDDMAVAAETGEKGEEISTAMKSVSQVMSKAEFSGFKKENEYWILKKWKSDGREQYEYTVVYAIDKNRLEDQVSGIVNREAKDSVKQDVSKVMSVMLADKFGI